MPTVTQFSDLPPAIRDDDEGLFSRDINGQLVRLDAPTKADYEKTATITIDGRKITVSVAKPLEDAQGNIVLDVKGQSTPRYTTILDAARQLYVKTEADEASFPIPTLCHQPHMKPVGVCRICAVQTATAMPNDTKLKRDRKLVPACAHPVKDGMFVFTMEDRDKTGKRTRDAELVWHSVKMLTRLLTADHLKDAPSPKPPVPGFVEELGRYNELQQLDGRLGLAPENNRFKHPALSKTTRPGPRPHPPNGDSLDISSRVFTVDHEACILCDRCSRACDDVKNNNIIGRTGKGTAAGIGFDLNVAMGESGCVQCGECMVSCPTSAITFKPPKPLDEVELSARAGDSRLLSAEELLSEPMFANVPPKFLLWQKGLAVQRRVKAGDVLCREGDPGNTAFLMRSGELEIVRWEQPAKSGKGLFVSLRSRKKPAESIMRVRRGPKDLFVGEMSCLSGSPRSADVTAAEDGEVWEIRRNLLDRLMRSPLLHEKVQEIYRKHALDGVLQGLELFRDVPAKESQLCADYLRGKLTFVRASPGQIIFERGSFGDCVYLIRLGHVRVNIGRVGQEEKVIYRASNTTLGEIGLLALSREDLNKTVEEVDKAVAAALREGVLPAGRRTATCSALDHVELVRISRDAFLQVLRLFPAIRSAFVKLALDRLRGDLDDRPLTREFVDQGLYQAQSLLVLDLKRCTHCDECTRACVDQHGTESHGAPLTRLLRVGVTFDNFLVATSCRSCKDAYCMLGCPVDAIHRGRHQQIVIEDHCIGCNLCEQNCPYGNIFMVTDEREPSMTPEPGHAGDAQRAKVKAATCDLCDAAGVRETPVPRCVYACPHDAAHRMTGAELLDRVTDVKGPG